ncbi:MAG: hypothetical protein D6694_07785 [Gammaproteobacteria bacterium]|nr:MAG: hypothetical protein D6694_07785 [Gammaproteobacteria bacterium]
MSIDRDLFLKFEEKLEKELEILQQNMDPDNPIPEIKLRINRINSALARIVDGTYGLCKKCGEEISIERLENNPVALLCDLCGTHERPADPMIQKILKEALAELEDDSDIDDDLDED